MGHLFIGDRGARAGVLVAALALAAGAAVAWLDARPNWDDTAILVALVVVASGGASIAGLSWWFAAILVAGPVVATEVGTAGPGIAVVLALGGIGALVGQRLRGRPHNAHAQETP